VVINCFGLAIRKKGSKPPIFQAKLTKHTYTHTHTHTHTLTHTHTHTHSHTHTHTHTHTYIHTYIHTYVYFMSPRGFSVKYVTKQQ